MPRTGKVIEQKLGKQVGFKLVLYEEHEERVINVIAPRNHREFDKWCKDQYDIELLDKAIDKWRYIAALILGGFVVDDCGGIFSCPLCRVFKPDHWHYCDACPITIENSEHESCEDTPYTSYQEAVTQEQYFRAAKEEVRFLRLVKEEIEHYREKGEWRNGTGTSERKASYLYASTLEE